VSSLPESVGEVLAASGVVQFSNAVAAIMD
jgi:hypothetical protein